MYRAIHLSVLLLCLLAGRSSAQSAPDTLVLDYPEAERLFLQQNLALLAQQYNVDISKALVRQARYWDNPYLSTDQNIYDGRFFRHKTVNGQQYGQIYLQLQQVILTAGKRNKLIRLADDNRMTSEQQLYDLLRNLRFVLATDFSTMSQLWQTNLLYTREITAVAHMVEGMEAQFQAGNISAKDNVRIKSLLYSLQSDQADLLRQIADVQKELHVLLQKNDSTFLMPRSLPVVFPEPPLLQQVLDSARANRPDLQLAQINLLSQQHNLSYQKALVSPDLTVGLEYDHLSNYVPNYFGLTVGLPIPILNRNKGNIAAAQFGVKQAQVGVDQAQTAIQQDIVAAYTKWLVAARINKNQVRELGDQYDTLLNNMVESYRQRQVSLIEFIDFFDSYKDSRGRQLAQQANFWNASAELNYTAGTTIIKLQ
ncbi:MAG TPA: TolC family protein [Chitinophagaceae bacterium]|nr:TolC family protein [Chitinophagaceae bacterium]